LKNYLASLKKNRGLKLLALLLALAAWFAVGSEERTETTLQMALELTNVPKHLMVTNETLSQIEVRVQGPRSVIRELTTEKLHKQIDLSKVKSGTHTELLTPSALNFPRGVTVTRIRPSALSIELDQAQIRPIEVQPVIKGSPAAGFEIGEVVVSPKEALLRGPKREIENLKFINTIPIDINKLSSSLTKDVELDFQNLPLTYLESQSLVAKIVIKPKLQTKTFDNMVVVPLGATGPLRLDPPKVSITVRGPVTNFGILRPEDITPRINLKNLKAGLYEAKVAADIPNELELLQISPEKIKVRIMK
jgi:YbbR domain-containing protein